jgi:hypothetical protein
MITLDVRYWIGLSADFYQQVLHLIPELVSDLRHIIKGYICQEFRNRALHF